MLNRAPQLRWIILIICIGIGICVDWMRGLRTAAALGYIIAWLSGFAIELVLWNRSRQP